MLQLEPWERFALLSIALEEVPSARAADVLAPFSSAAMTVVRHMAGTNTRGEAYAAVERARVVIEEARRAT